MSRLIKLLLAIFLLVSSLGVFFAYQAYTFLNTPAADPGVEKLFDVPQGANLASIARDLASQGLITDSRKFEWLARLKKEGTRLQAGRFALNSGWTPEKILDTLVNGKAMLYRITIPEGLTWWQTGKLLEENGFLNFDDFRKVIMDPDFLRHYGIPFSTAEGFLMPDTYLLKKADFSATDKSGELSQGGEAQARAIAGRLVDNFWKRTTPLWPGVAGSGKNSPIPRLAREDLKKWTTLASIVEKETALDAERPRVAGVYANRLARNMLLQADPTVIYGLGESFTGQLLRRHLNDPQNPYNTYQKNGLPPGPIASFGLASLKAAINPEKHDYLYFVAITDGGAHKFSENLQQHNQAVQEYRRQKSQK